MMTPPCHPLVVPEEELLSPTFLILAGSVGVATVVVLILLAAICSRLCTRPGYTVAKIQVRAWA
jgi:hypothetical protein